MSLRRRDYLACSMIVGLALTAAIGAPALAQDFSPDELTSRAIERRAVEAVNWGMPAVNYDRMVQAMLGAKGAFARLRSAPARSAPPEVRGWELGIVEDSSRKLCPNQNCRSEISPC
jgi:hypothetical protein